MSETSNANGPHPHPTADSGPTWLFFLVGVLQIALSIYQFTAHGFFWPACANLFFGMFWLVYGRRVTRRQRHGTRSS